MCTKDYRWRSRLIASPGILPGTLRDTTTPRQAVENAVVGQFECNGRLINGSDKGSYVRLLFLKLRLVYLRCSDVRPANRFVPAVKLHIGIPSAPETTEAVFESFICCSNIARKVCRDVGAGLPFG